ncbi:DUF6520 family protein [Mucilaginibacter sp.]|jgi:hypothetical protein|uniref:DUF6520 family protein n=1 Tax=Mucilaginibacter sp. TaxID=1882438 RepID=UPI00356ADB63
MKRLKINLAVIAILLGTGAAYATNFHKDATVFWGKRANGTYVIADSNDLCNNLTPPVCKAEYPEGQNPNMDPSDPISTTPGTFVQVP